MDDFEKKYSIYKNKYKKLKRIIDEKKLYSYQNAKDFIADYKLGKINFPLKRLYKSDDDVIKMFNKLRKFDTSDRIVYDRYYSINTLNIDKKDLTFNGRPTIFISKKTDYENFNILSDMFLELERMKCRFKNNPSPFDYFKNNYVSIADKTIEKYNKITPYTLRETIYANTKECSNFRSNNIINTINFLYPNHDKNFSVLDPSAGWGDRLIGSMSMDIYYTGVDPNEKLHPYYQQMIGTLCPNSKNKYKMILSPFEKLDLGNNMYDLVFTSPPYFDLEIYSDSDLQSVNYNTKKELDWFNYFFKQYLSNAWNHLKKDCYMVININQKNRNEQYVYLMLNYMDKEIKDARYCGVIGYTNQEFINPQPMFIWKKI